MGRTTLASCEVRLIVPAPSLIVLIGPAGCGKSTFAGRQFQATEIISSDRCRAMVSDDENDQSATESAFKILHLIVRERLKARRLAVVDATNVEIRARQPLIAMAQKRHVPPVAIALALSLEECLRRNEGRQIRTVPVAAVQWQHDLMTSSLPGLRSEGFRSVYILDSPEAIETAVVVRQA